MESLWSMSFHTYQHLKNDFLNFNQLIFVCVDWPLISITLQQGYGLCKRVTRHQPLSRYHGTQRFKFGHPSDNPYPCYLYSHFNVLFLSHHVTIATPFFSFMLTVGTSSPKVILYSVCVHSYYNK